MSDLDDRVLRIGELRKMITQMRKEYTPPIGKMKRADLLAHYRQLSGLKPAKPDVKPNGAAPPKKTAPRVVRHEEEEEEEEEPAPKPKPKAAPKPAPKPAPKAKMPPVYEEEEQVEEPRQRGVPGRAPFVPRQQREEIGNSINGYGARAPARGRKNLDYEQND
jgi:outer membrane biosynthesis protein TonB